MYASKKELIQQYAPLVDAQQLNCKVWVYTPCEREVFVLLEKDKTEVFGFFQFMNGKKWYFKQPIFQKGEDLYFECMHTHLPLDSFQKVSFEHIIPYVVTSSKGV